MSTVAVYRLDSSNGRMPMATRSAGNAADAGRFEQTVMPHLDAAYNLARWLVRNTHDAEDVVQEACLRRTSFLAAFKAAMRGPGC